MPTEFKLAPVFCNSVFLSYKKNLFKSNKKTLKIMHVNVKTVSIL